MIRKILKKIVSVPHRIDRYFEKKKYLKGKYAEKIKIESPYDTLLRLKDHIFSFYRFGDGELAIMRGESIPFQSADTALQSRLTELVRVNVPGVQVGLPRYYFYPEKNLNLFTSQFAYAQKKNRLQILSLVNVENFYIDTGVTQVYQSYSIYDFEKYFNTMQEILEDKEVTLVCGKGILDNILYNPLAGSKSLTIIEAPNKNAFSNYDEILKCIKKEPKHKLICIILGPTAKPLVYDLFLEGYTAWDLGHYIKDYDAYKRKISRTEENIKKFYMPD